jgi:hypothetical protein
MAALFYVPGPIEITWGGVELGQTDGQQRIVVREVIPHREVTTDDAGGEAVDFIQLQGHGLVTIPLIQWDDDVLDDFLAALTTTAGTFANPGNTGGVGMLRVADQGYKQLIISSTKPRSSNGGHDYTFPRAMRDPNSETALEDVSAGITARRIITFRCMPDGSGNWYTRADTT